MDSYGDEHLLRRYLAGDHGAITERRRYARRVHATALRLTGQIEDAEDTFQEVSVELARHTRKIRSGRTLSIWLYRSTVNRAADRSRSATPANERGQA